MEIKGPGFRGMGESLNTGSGWSRALVGTIQISEPGSHTVKAEPAIEGGVERRFSSESRCEGARKRNPFHGEAGSRSGRSGYSTSIVTSGR